MKKTALVLALILAGCSSLPKEQTDYVRDGVVDCTTSAAQQAIDAYQSDIEELIKTDRAKAESVLRGFGKTTGACVLANIIAGVVSGKLGATTTVGLTAAEARALFDRLRREQWDGAQYKTDAGVL